VRFVLVLFFVDCIWNFEDDNENEDEDKLPGNLSGMLTRATRYFGRGAGGARLRV
jgi:hypothetical protein